MDLILQNIKIKNFKNILSAELTFSEKLNCFSGLNGAGKTNLLDAIHYLSLTKSYFYYIDSQSVNYNKNDFFIGGNFLRKQKKYEISCYYSKNAQKIIKLDGKKYKRFSDHIGIFPSVMITPFDTSLIYEGSEERRRFLDTIISQFDKEYLQNLISYKKILLQRNQLLKKFALNRSFDKEFLEIFDTKLVKLSAAVFRTRAKFSEDFVRIFRFYYSKLSSDAENPDIIYKSHHLKGDLREILQEALPRDLALQYTTVGVHRDDLIFKINDKLLKRNGSNGQQKSFIIAMKFAQAEILTQKTGLKPVMMLDDIFDKLDEKRVKELINLITGEKFGQIFITHTNLQNLEKMLSKNTNYKKFHVQNGVITEKK